MLNVHFVKTSILWTSVTNRIHAIVIVRNKLHQTYFEAFNFYFAKPINEMLANVPSIPNLIRFKDY